MYQWGVPPPAPVGTLHYDCRRPSCQVANTLDLHFSTKKQVGEGNKTGKTSFILIGKITKDKGILSPGKKEDSSDFLINNSK